MKKLIYKLQEIHNICEDIFATDLSDEEKYDIIFSDNVSKYVYSLFKENSISFDYYDPDTSYNEDMKAFVNALSNKIEDLKLIEDNQLSGDKNELQNIIQRLKNVQK